jgi:hypothetical protein
LYAIKNACQPSSVANHGKRHGWRLGAPIESLFLTPSVLETRPSQRTVTAIQKGVFFLNFRVVATTVPFETRSPSQPGANLGLFHVNLAIPYQWRIDTSIIPIFSNASLLKTGQLAVPEADLFSLNRLELDSIATDRVVWTAKRRANGIAIKARR